jgi:hypothetical protein
MAVALSLSFAFSGFAVMTGRNWLLYLAVASWLPFLLGLLAPQQMETIGSQWAAKFSLVFALSYYAGFSQLWVFGFIFYGLTYLLMLLLRVAPVRSILWHVPATLLGLALAAPLLYVQLDFAKDVDRVFSIGSEGVGIPLESFPAMIVPPPLIPVKHPEYTEDYGYGQYYYLNLVYAASLIVAILALPWFRPSRSFLGNNVLFVTALVALALVLGAESPLPLIKWLSAAPWLCKFRDPWRYYAIFEIFAMFAGALLLDRLLAGLRQAMFWRWSASAIILALMFHSVSLSKPTWQCVLNLASPGNPYPSLPAKLTDLMESCTSTTAFPNRIAEPYPQAQFSEAVRTEEAFSGMTSNMPSVWSIYSFNRYNTLTWFHHFAKPLFDQYNKHPTEAYRAYGIRWIVRHLKGPYLPEFVQDLGPPREFDNLQVWEVTNPCPLAFDEQKPTTPLPVSFSLRGVDADVHDVFPNGGNLVVNVLAWPNFRVFADGARISSRPDTWGRIVAAVPPGATRVQAIYTPPLAKGGVAASVLAVVAAVIWIGLVKLERTQKQA